MNEQYIINNKKGTYKKVETTEELMEFIEHEIEKSSGTSITIQSRELIDLFNTIDYDTLEDASIYWEIEEGELYIREF